MPFRTLPEETANDGQTLLKELRVLDLTTSIAGPYATQLLADLGATVIKVEKSPAGDDSRQWGPPFIHGESPWFLSVNRNKHSISLDLRQPAGFAVLERLLEKSDVLVLNMISRVQSKLGLDYERLHAKYPGLIHASLTGFGLTGQRKNLPCYDLIAEGYSGVMDLTGEITDGPQKVGTPAADLLAGQDLAMAVMAAYIARQRTGQGSQVDISMQASMTRFMGPRLLSYLSSGELPRRAGGRDSVIAVYQVFDTLDQPMSLGLGNDAIWKRFWRAVGQADVGELAEYTSNADRRAHREAIVARIADILKTRTRDSWLALLAEHGIPAGPINRLDEVTQDADLLEKGFFFKTEAACGTIPQVGLGIGFDERQQVYRKPPPSLGEDTCGILENLLEMTPQEIDTLRAAQVI